MNTTHPSNSPAYNRAEAVQQFYENISGGTMSFSDIQHVMHERGYEEDEINAVARIVDSMLRQQAVSKSERSTARNLFAVGLILTVLGVIITGYTWLNGYLQGGIMIIAFGPMVGGAGMLSVGFERMKRK